MKIIGFAIIFFLGLTQCHSQYVFSGEIPKKSENKTVYLSLVENYRKSSRVYTDQILKETQANSNGVFKFEGDNLSAENRIYRIHIDGCEENTNGGSHFLKDCNNSQSILFIAKKGDHIVFPLLENNQSLCEIESTNRSSGLLLEIAALKEEMILDFMEYNSKANETLNFRKWFSTFQEFGVDNGEPLAELYMYAFLSDRTSETYSHYFTDARTNPYYGQLLERLYNTYPNTTFTAQYAYELSADKATQHTETLKSKSGFMKYLFYGALLFLIIQVVYFNIKKHVRVLKKKATEGLTSQEQNIFKAICAGKTNKEIAAGLFISVSTVKTHINNLYKKLNVKSREELKKL